MAVDSNRPGHTSDRDDIDGLPLSRTSVPKFLKKGKDKIKKRK